MIRIIALFLIVIVAFWMLIINFFPTKEPELVYLNETEVVTVIEEPWTVGYMTYISIPLDVQKGDVLNITIEVVNGGPIDFFILEEDSVENLIGALEGTNNRFQSYERGRGLNVTYATTEFIIINNENWFIFLNNYGHIQGGARPSSEAQVMVNIRKIGINEAGGFSITS